MKRILFSLVLAVLALCLGACSSTGSLSVQTPAQIASQVCPPVQTTLTSLSFLVLDPKVTADLAVAKGAVDLVCSAGEAINLASLQTMATTALPSVIEAIKASPMSVSDQNQAILDLTAASIILQGAIQAATPAAPVAAPVPVAPASAAAS
jgi:hypothetical protein